MENSDATHFDRAKAAEIDLLSPETRRDGARVCELLHDDFSEIGRSGRRWARAEIVAMLADEDGRDAPLTDEWHFDLLAPEIVLATYRITGASGTSRHSSIWDMTNGSPRVRFHQGTRSE